MLTGPSLRCSRRSRKSVVLSEDAPCEVGLNGPRCRLRAPLFEGHEICRSSLLRLRSATRRHHLWCPETRRRFALLVLGSGRQMTPAVPAEAVSLSHESKKPKNGLQFRLGNGGHLWQQESFNRRLHALSWRFSQDASPTSQFMISGRHRSN